MIGWIIAPEEDRERLAECGLVLSEERNETFGTFEMVKVQDLGVARDRLVTAGYQPGQWFFMNEDSLMGKAYLERRIDGRTRLREERDEPDDPQTE